MWFNLFRYLFTQDALESNININININTELISALGLMILTRLSP